MVVACVVGGLYLWLRPQDDARREDPQRAQGYARPRVIGRIQVPELTELSGLAASIRNPGKLWAHNDSGSEPVLYCLSLRGAPCGSWEVTGATAFDWEDMSAAPVDEGTPALYIGDIGDNEGNRPNVVVYIVREPDVGRGEGGALPARSVTLTYPDRPHDAESLVVHPTTGDVYVVTKSFSRQARVYVARAPLRSRMQLSKVATTRSFGLLAARTGASVSPDGGRVAFSTYASGYEIRLPRGAPFDEIWEQEPLAFELGDHLQGEALTYTRSGHTIISSSEGRRAPIYEVKRRGAGS